jgi:hypothetical protein
MSNGRTIINNEFERIWKEAAMDHGVTIPAFVSNNGGGGGGGGGMSGTHCPGQG